MKPDIASRKDIHFIISSFYDKLLSDESMFPFFEEITNNNELSAHLESIADFWNDVLFDTVTYKKNVMQKHLTVHRNMKFKKSHFDVWISYFFDVIDANFSGEKSIVMKNRASSIATVMQLKMNIYK
ncbi:group III truncated hemoglobin [Polaribacter dokdonensis]|uniref:Globin n=1 Tax=Polaribacter dokdonensis DSW-5 TaxID=1300348 RepID=A0A0N0CEP5_9FLAO|nr:group III truncated hemoglobin [Polaribacter dokdonensis]KOY50638.1 Globin [Polaribacter dokdonensis DSW-5]SEE62071.1 hemoglobin [Polaribacter dokdonensis DSW-5]